MPSFRIFCLMSPQHPASKLPSCVAIARCLRVQQRGAAAAAGARPAWRRRAILGTRGGTARVSERAPCILIRSFSPSAPSRLHLQAAAAEPQQPPARHHARDWRTLRPDERPALRRVSCAAAMRRQCDSSSCGVGTRWWRRAWTVRRRAAARHYTCGPTSTRTSSPLKSRLISIAGAPHSLPESFCRLPHCRVQLRRQVLQRRVDVWRDMYWMGVKLAKVR